MNNLTTRKIVLGMLMVLVLTFSVQGIADALTLNEVSNIVQSKRMTPGLFFEITFSTGLTKPTIAENSNGQRVSDAIDGSAVLIDSDGYTVTYLPNGKAYRILSGVNVSTLVGYDTSYDSVAFRKGKTYQELSNGTFYADSKRNVYTADAKPVMHYTPDNSSTADEDEEQVGSQVQILLTDFVDALLEADRFDYNEEKVTIAITAVSTTGITIRAKSDNQPVGTMMSERDHFAQLTDRVTLVCEITVAGTYVIRITDSTADKDFPVSPGAPPERASIMFTLFATTEDNEEVDAATVSAHQTRIDTAEDVETVSSRFEVGTDADDVRVRYKVVEGNGTLYVGTFTESFTNPTQDLTVHQDADVYINMNGTTNEVSASIAGADRKTFPATIVFEYSGSTRPTRPTTTTTTTTQTATNRITISPLNTTGEPGEEVTINVTSSPSGVFATLGSNDFGATRFSPQSGVTPFTSTLLLPVEEGTHAFFATSGTFTAGTASVTVETGILGEISISQIGTPSNGAQSFSITVVDTDSARISGSLTVRVSGSGFTTRNVDTLNGVGNARLTLPTAASLYTLTASAEGYTSGTTQVRIAGTGQQQVADEDEEEVEEEVTVAAEPDSIEITGPSTRSGTVNEELDTPLLVRVLDDDGDGLEGARVFYRVISGRGRLSARGNGRAIGVVTDSDGYARAVFTPLDGGTITVRANTDDLSATVTFTITTGSAPSASGARDSGTGSTPGTGGTPGTISPVVHVVAASRPPMLWVDGGAIYALVGASPQRFASSVDNALNIAVAGGKVYWTEKTGESGGTINSANLNGSDVTELASVRSCPDGDRR